MFWILIGSSATIYWGIMKTNPQAISMKLHIVQWTFWIISIVGIGHGYVHGKFGGREYWEFEPLWALPIALAYLLLLFNFFKAFRKVERWPVYLWMWMTGIVFFLFTFAENYLWLFPYFRKELVTDMTIQWKVNGSLVGSFNQIVYGTALYIMQEINGDSKVATSRLAFAMYFLGLFNLMFNWGHHIYSLPTDAYIRYIGYAVSMTEWVILLRIIYKWRASITTAQKYSNYFPYRFIVASDFWVLINLTQAIFLSIPAINKYTHGTHVTVAHAMGTTIGINTMILLGAFFHLNKFTHFSKSTKRSLSLSFWITQVGLFIFWLSLNIAGIQKGLWQLSENQIPFGQMMDNLKPIFRIFTYAGILIMLSLSVLSVFLIVKLLKTKTITTPK